MQAADLILERCVRAMPESPDHRAALLRRRGSSHHPSPGSARGMAALRAMACLAALTLGVPAPMPVAAQTMDVATVPGMPTDSDATTSSKTRIKLSWTSPTNTGGADTAITGYRIEYSAPDYLFAEDTNVWTALEANTGSTSTTYDHDHELAPGVRLQYRISAINEVGVGNPSDVAETTTQAAPDTAGNGAPDTTGITVNGRRIVIAFDEALDSDAIPNRTQFQVTINRDIPVRPERVEVTGATVVLALEAGDAVDADDTVGVRYTWPRVVIGDAEVPQTIDALQDVEGNLVVRWNLRLATNETTDSGVTVEPETVAVEEGGSGTYTVVLNSQPTAEVTIDIRAGGDVTVNPARLTFGTSDWDTARTVTASAARDDDGDDDSVTVVHDMTSADPNYDGTDAASVTVTVEDLYAETGTPEVDVSTAALTVADAEATEHEATMDFVVALDAPATTSVTVDYATADGSATAGEDYVGRIGTLTFAAGEVRKTVSVPVLDDARNEDDETFTLTLSNPSGARIENGEATGTIANNDSLQTAWLARFGRTVGAQVVNAVSARLEGNPGSRITVGGRRLGTSGSAASPVAMPEHWADRAEDAWNRDPGSTRTMTGRALLSASSFHLASEGEGGGPSFAAWGHVASGGFEADVSDVGMDGDVTTGILGADVSSGRWLTGAAVSFSEGEGGYRLESNAASAFDEGTVESSLTSVYPYARLRLGERVSAWGLVGYGTGDLALIERSEASTNRYATRTKMRLGALGARGTLVPAPEAGGFELAVKSDAFWMRMTSDAVEGVRGADADASRLRLVLAASRWFDAGDGATLTPNMELGLRRDGGDAETGTGMEVGVGIRYAGAGVSIEGSVRGLVAHEAGSYEEWGASGSARIDPGAAGRGFSLTLAPTWGNASSAQERLWSARDAGGLVSGPSFEPERRFTAELGYGLAAPRCPGLVTPYAGLAWADSDRRTWSAGMRWKIAPRASLSLQASSSESSGDDGPANAVTLRVGMRW